MDIVLSHISKSFGDKRVLRDFSHCFPEGEFSCILGPSGCGKTTLLRIIMGLEQADSGSVTGLKGKKNSAVFQENRLFENLTVEKNVLLTARRGFTRSDAHLLLDALGIGAEAARPLRSLSGGMQRRAAIARALAADYDLLLLDEPLSGLDGDTRLQVLKVIRSRAAGRTVLCVTHDIRDAHYLGAHVLQMQSLSIEADADLP